MRHTNTYTMNGEGGRKKARCASCLERALLFSGTAILQNHMCCPPVVTSFNFAKTLNLPCHSQESPTRGVAFMFADHQVEMDRVKPSECSRAAYNYIPLPACLPIQPHPCMLMGSLLLPSPSDCWHSVGNAARAVVVTSRRIYGETISTL